MKATLEMDMPRSCRKCKLCYGGIYCALTKNLMIDKNQNSRPKWCELKPKKKHLYEVRMEKLGTGGMGEIECPGDMGSEFSIYEERCNEMTCAECWSQEVQEEEADKIK